MMSGKIAVCAAFAWALSSPFTRAAAEIPEDFSPPGFMVVSNDKCGTESATTQGETVERAAAAAQFGLDLENVSPNLVLEGVQVFVNCIQIDLLSYEENLTAFTEDHRQRNEREWYLGLIEVVSEQTGVRADRVYIRSRSDDNDVITELSPAGLFARGEGPISVGGSLGETFFLAATGSTGFGSAEQFLIDLNDRQERVLQQLVQRVPRMPLHTNPRGTRPNAPRVSFASDAEASADFNVIEARGWATGRDAHWERLSLAVTLSPTRCSTARSAFRFLPHVRLHGQYAHAVRDDPPREDLYLNDIESDYARRVQEIERALEQRLQALTDQMTGCQGR